MFLGFNCTRELVLNKRKIYKTNVELTKRSTTSWAACEFWTTTAADQMAALALQDGWQNIVKTNGTFKK